MEYFIRPFYWPVLYFTLFIGVTQDLTMINSYVIISEMKKRRISLILIAVPFLMANSPAPRPSYKDYTDIETSVNKIHDYAYRLNVKNVGDAHLYRNNFNLYDEDDILINNFSLKSENAIFNSQVLGPNESSSYIIQYSPDQKVDLNVAKVTTTAYSNKDESVKYSAPTIVRTQSTEYDYYYKVDSKFSNFGDYYYQAAVTVKYKGELYSFTIGTTYKTFATYEELDLEQISVESISFYRSDYNTYKNNGLYYAYAALLYAAQYLPYVLVGLLIIVPPAIIIPISVTKAVKRRRRQEQDSKK